MRIEGYFAKIGEFFNVRSVCYENGLGPTSGQFSNDSVMQAQGCSLDDWPAFWKCP